MNISQAISRVSLMLSLFVCAPVLESGCASKITPEPAVASSEVLKSFDSRTLVQPATMRISSRVDYVDEAHNKRVVGQDLVISSRSPQSMRITISAFDKAVATLVTDGVAFALMDVGQNAYVTGMATPENISRILPVFLSAADLYRVIHGMFPIDDLTDDAYETQTFAWDGRENGYCRSLNMKNGNVQHVYYKYPGGDIFKIIVKKQDKAVYTYEASDFKDYKSAGNTYRFPTKILFSLPELKTDVRLRVDKVDFNVELSDAVFMLMPQQGSQIFSLEDE